MDFESIMSLLSNVAFPIVAFLLIWKDSRDMRQSHKEETDRLSDVIAGNTAVLEQIRGVMLHENND